MATMQIPTAGQHVTVTFLPGHRAERALSGRLFEAFGALVIQPPTYQSDEFLPVVLASGELNPNLRIDAVA